MPSLRDAAKWVVKRISALTRMATDANLTDSEYMAVDDASAYTRKITVASLATWILKQWAAFVNALIAKASFANGDKIPVVNGSTATAMEADKLLELTAQNAFNFSKERDFFATKQSLASETARAVAKENEIESLFVLPTAEAVATWLDAHPEATTTVQDQSLTNKKLVVGTLNFVTPEMFGAVGDGVADDTTAINNMLADGGKYCLFNDSKTYKVTGVLRVSSNTFINLNGCTILSSALSHIFFSLGSVDNRNHDITIMNGNLHGSGEDNHVGDQGAGILFWRVDNARIENIYTTNTYGDGFCLRECENCAVVNCRIEKFGRNGISPTSGTFFIDRLVVIDNHLAGANPAIPFDCEPDTVDEISRFHITNCDVPSMTFVDFRSSEGSNFNIEVYMDNTRVVGHYSGLRFISTNKTIAKRVKVKDCLLKGIASSSSARISNVNGIEFENCVFDNENKQSVNSHAISLDGSIEGLVVKNASLLGWSNVIFHYTGNVENCRFEKFEGSIYAKLFKDNVLVDSRLTALNGVTDIVACTGNRFDNSICPDSLKPYALFGNMYSQIIGGSIVFREFPFTAMEDDGLDVFIPIAATDTSKGHCYLLSIGYSHRGSIADTGYRLVSVVFGDHTTTFTDIFTIGSKSITLSKSQDGKGIVAHFQKCFTGTLSYTLIG